MYLPHAIALRASLAAPGTLALDDHVYRLFQQIVCLFASGYEELAL